MPKAGSELTEDVVQAEKPWINGNIRANGIRFHTVEHPESLKTPTRHELILFTHGFAENWKVFVSQLQYFSQLGFRAVAYDARGYGATDKPPHGYDAWSLAADIKGIIHALGYEKAIIVATDDGGISAWTFASLHPQMTTALITLNSPHPLAMVRSVLAGRNFRFLVNWLRFQIPIYSSYALQNNFASAIVHRLRRFGYNPWLASPEFTKQAEYLRTAMCLRTVSKHAIKRHHWVFRSAFQFEGHRFREALNTHIVKPVMSIYGNYDDLISEHAIKKTRKWAKNIQFTPLEAGHFPHLEQPDQVNQAISQFLLTHNLITATHT